jgi:hypothetical protein
MRPTGVTLIALYHFLAAALLILLAIALMVGGTVLGGTFGSGRFGGALGLFVGVVGAAITLVFAVVAGVAGYGVWNLREWGRILCIALAAIALLFSVPGLLMMGLHLGFFFGGYRLIRIAISVLIIWYLVQPQIKALFQPRLVPAPPVQ